MKTLLAIGILAAFAAILVGCGSSVDSMQPQRRDTPSISQSGGANGQGATPQATENVTASEIDFQGWKALRMQNGLCEVVCVPAIGGRIMSYALGDHNVLWINPEEYGKTYPRPHPEADSKWHNFGGYKAWVAPEAVWRKLPDPTGQFPEGSPWDGKISTPGGVVAEITMVSPADKQVTGLQITRRVRLYAGTTKVQVRETYKNVTDKPIHWGIWDVTQVNGRLATDKEFSNEAHVYIPLNPNSKFKDGFFHIVKTEKDTEQFAKIADGKVLETTYKHLTDKIGTDSVAGWAAALDGIANIALVKRFTVEKGREYPDDGSTVENWTNPDYPYMELEVMSPLYDIAPGKEVSFEEQWYLAKVGAPITDATDAAAIQTPIAISLKDGEATLSGEFGVFAPGKLKIAFMDGKNKALGDPVTVSVNPSQTVKLDQKIKVPKGAVKLAVKVNDAKDNLVGMVAEVPVAADAATATASGPAGAASGAATPATGAAAPTGSAAAAPKDATPKATTSPDTPPAPPAT